VYADRHQRLANLREFYLLDDRRHELHRLFLCSI
jgi:hypothetical protein